MATAERSFATAALIHVKLANVSRRCQALRFRTIHNLFGKKRDVFNQLIDLKSWSRMISFAAANAESGVTLIDARAGRSENLFDADW